MSKGEFFTLDVPQVGGPPIFSLALCSERATVNDGFPFIVTQHAFTAGELAEALSHDRRLGVRLLAALVETREQRIRNLTTGHTPKGNTQ